MPIPWEACIPAVLMITMFGIAGNLTSGIRWLENDGKRPRYNLDRWDDMMMERDRRLTGSFRGQSTDPIAPKEFATSSVWGTEKIN
ncbi:hypothetical protein IAT38_004940 [Cryptococcus sp. DSM 104549]